MTLIFGRERLLSSGCVQVHDLTTYNNRILEHRLHMQLGLSFLFGSAFQIMHMHRDLSTSNGDQTHT